MSKISQIYIQNDKLFANINDILVNIFLSLHLIVVVFVPENLINSKAEWREDNFYKKAALLWKEIRFNLSLLRLKTSRTADLAQRQQASIQD